MRTFSQIYHSGCWWNNSHDHSAFGDVTVKSLVAPLTRRSTTTNVPRLYQNTQIWVTSLRLIIELNERTTFAVTEEKNDRVYWEHFRRNKLTCWQQTTVQQERASSAAGPDHPWGWWGSNLRAGALIGARYNENLQSIGPLWAPKFLEKICGLLKCLPQRGPGPEGPAVAFMPQGPEGPWSGPEQQQNRQRMYQHKPRIATNNN